MSFIRSRLRRLEASPAASRCPGCKLSPGSPGYSVLADGEHAPALDREGRPVDPDERCAGCGRYLWFVIRVVEAGPEKPPRGEGASVAWPM